MVSYLDSTPSELRRKDNGEKLDLAGRVASVDPIDEQSPQFVVSYSDSTLSELRRKDNGEKIADLAGRVASADPIDEQSPFFVATYWDGTPAELRRKDNGEKVADLPGGVVSVYPIDAASPFFVATYWNGTPSELRRKDNGEKVADLPGGVVSVYPIDAASPYFVVSYVDDKPSELRRKDNSEKVADLAGPVASVDPMNAASPYFVVSYPDDKPSELRRKDNGEKVDTEVGQVFFDQHWLPGHFLLQRSNTLHAELWQLTPLRKLVDLGKGVSWPQPQRAIPLWPFDEKYQTLAVPYGNGQAYLLDLVWLTQMYGVEIAGDTGNTVACMPFSVRPFDKDDVLHEPKYLDERESLACPEQLLSWGSARYMAQPHNVDEAIHQHARRIGDTIAQFVQTQDMEPAAAGELQALMRRLVAEVLVTNGRRMAGWGDRAGAIEALEQAVELDPSLTITPEAEAARLAPTVTPTPARETALSPTVTPTPMSPESR